MTQFDKSKFSYHGGYLEYKGSYKGQPTYDEVYGADKIHPSRIGMPMELFIARFKYSGPFTKAKFVAELCKNWTVEEYVQARTGGSPFGHNCNSPLDVLSERNPKWFKKIMDNFKTKQRGFA
mgnify:FL=1